jgi:hypothetical protein
VQQVEDLRLVLRSDASTAAKVAEVRRLLGLAWEDSRIEQWIEDRVGKLDQAREHVPGVKSEVSPARLHVPPGETRHVSNDALRNAMRQLPEAWTEDLPGKDCGALRYTRYQVKETIVGEQQTFDLGLRFRTYELPGERRFALVLLLFGDYPQSLPDPGQTMRRVLFEPWFGLHEIEGMGRVSPSDHNAIVRYMQAHAGKAWSEGDVPTVDQMAQVGVLHEVVEAILTSLLPVDFLYAYCDLYAQRGEEAIATDPVYLKNILYAEDNTRRCLREMLSDKMALWLSSRDCQDAFAELGWRVLPEEAAVFKAIVAYLQHKHDQGFHVFELTPDAPAATGTDIYK